MITKAIPTNIITGFLGVGKTSLIKQLLATKPEGETWAVLVNEFGEVGIDAGLLNSSDDGIHIREVAGGCMCCAAGVPTQVAITQLIARAKPDRLLIEPTGLGHPVEIIKLLSAPHYRNIIRLCSTLCLVDARKLCDPRYVAHPNFIAQLQSADIVLAAKADLYPEFEAQQAVRLQPLLEAFLLEHRMAPAAILPHSLAEGELLSKVSVAADLAPKLRLALDFPRISTIETDTVKPQVNEPHLIAGKSALFEAQFSSLFADGRELAFTPSDALNAQGFMRKHNSGEGCVSCGWVFDSGKEFEFEGLMAFVKQQTQAEALLRLKALMITADGILGINCVGQDCQLLELDDALDSRLEIIASEPLAWDDIEAKLLACALS